MCSIPSLSLSLSLSLLDAVGERPPPARSCRWSSLSHAKEVDQCQQNRHGQEQQPFSDDDSNNSSSVHAGYFPRGAPARPPENPRGHIRLHRARFPQQGGGDEGQLHNLDCFFDRRMHFSKLTVLCLMQPGVERHVTLDPCHGRDIDATIC